MRRLGTATRNTLRAASIANAGPPFTTTLGMSSQALIIVANPSVESFSHAMAKVASEALRLREYELAYHDLYDERFDPVQPAGEGGNRTSSDELVETHCRQLAAASLILIFHPNWWGQPPAILKGWIDRVFRLGVAYDYPPGVGAESAAIGLLRARSALVFNTSNTPWDREVTVFRNPLESLWKDCVFGLCGVSSFERQVFGPMASSTPKQRDAWLAEVRNMVARHA
jgi:NAD(P)H dehydrogenase (quinone)